MIRAGSIGIRATYDEEYDENGQEIADTEWDEKGNNNISHIYVSYNNCIITSIQFGYLDNGGIGDLILSTKFGVSDGQNFRAVILNEDEYVTGLSGVRGLLEGIKS
ncbi:unnamed protein product [Microthlaspi erraticum]|uniref:Jacalin-type lectin domain-containing protein n=1 Tax=Microthlaspi erraticum TaxID=1685480 RepID=A0A6D2KDS6_9BRAS|nr:unnamed protein product [Microthlaspi erraticum]